jgi:hypothetical protein
MHGTDQRLKLIVGGAVVLLILITLATFFFISRAKQIEVATNGSLDSLSTLRVTVTPTPLAPQAAPVIDTSTTKLYTGTGFSLRYPKTWGLLTCNNSANFELDPSSPTDTNISCDRAVKPITFLVSPNLNCQGDLVNLGTHQVLKSKTTLGGDTDYRWCVGIGTNTALDITHRVSQSGSRATSKEDYSSQIEELIKTISTTPRGS